MQDSRVDNCSYEESDKSTIEKTPKWDESLKNNADSKFLLQNENSFSKPGDINL